MKPSNYAQFSFRIDEEEKKILNKRLDNLLEILQSNQKEDEYVMRKNDLILRALKRGLTLLENQK